MLLRACPGRNCSKKEQKEAKEWHRTDVKFQRDPTQPLIHEFAGHQQEPII